MPKITKTYCETHNSSFKNFEELNKHIRDHHLDLTCNMCGRSFPNEISLKLHQQANHKKNSSVNSKGSKQSHINNRYSKKNKQYNIGQIIRRTTRLRHYKTTCNNCFQVNHTPTNDGKSANILEVHPYIQSLRGTQMERKDKTYHCVPCKEQFANEKALKTHNSQVHPNIVLVVKNLKN